MILFVIGGGYAPTAVVMNDRGPYAQQFYQAMSGAHSFRLQQTSAQEAETLLHSGRIVAAVTVPADFDARIRQNQPVQVGVQINNLNTDFTNDIRRAIPLSITSFYAKAFPHLVTVAPHEQDAYAQDTDYVPYLSVSILVVGIMLGGVLQSGLGTAREWESATLTSSPRLKPGDSRPHERGFLFQRGLPTRAFARPGLTASPHGGRCWGRYSRIARLFWPSRLAFRSRCSS